MTRKQIIIKNFYTKLKIMAHAQPRDTYQRGILTGYVMGLVITGFVSSSQGQEMLNDINIIYKHGI